MLPLTRDDLRSELQHFAETTLQSQLENLITAIREGVRLDSMDIISSSFSQQVLSPSPASGRSLHQATLPDPEASHLPGQPVNIDASQDVCSPGSKVDQGRANEKQPGKLKMAWDTTSSTIKSDDTEKNFEHKNADMRMSDIDDSKTARHAMLRKDTKSDALSETSVDAYQLFTSSSLINRIVCGDTFEQCILVVIGLNTVFLAVETEVAVSDFEMSRNLVFQIIDLVFLMIFAIELVLRIHVFRCSFFQSQTPWGQKNQQQAWNIFDCFIVVLQALEMLLVAVSEKGSVLGSITILRFFRMLRMGRLFRVRRLQRLFKFLRIIVASIYHSIAAFFWAVVSLEVIIFVFALYFTELTGVRVEAGEHGGEDNPELLEHFGSLWRSQLSLLKAVTGGIDWGDLEQPLRHLGVLSASLPFIGYLLFMLIVTMNIFTGIFLDSATQRALHDREIHLVKAAHGIFKASDWNANDTISKADFKRNLEHPDVHDFFEAIDLDIQQAEVLFSLLDCTGDGAISYDEFLRGCLRLRGNAKALDLLILSREVNHLFAKATHGEHVSRRMLSDLHALAKANTGEIPTNSLKESG